MNKTITLATFVGISIILAFGVTLIPSENQANAEVTPFPSREKVISVTGTATASVDPDLLVIQFGVETQKLTAKEALESNSALLTSVVGSIETLRISNDELSTSRFSVTPIYDSYRDEKTGRYTQELLGYRVSNVIMVETTSLDAAGEIIDSAVSAGANRVDSVYFKLSPAKNLQIKDDLIEKAVLNAKTKAEKALAPLNHKIIGVKAISLSEFGMPPPMFDASFAMAESAVMKSSTPVFSSDQEVSTTANVIFLIGSN